MKLSFLPAALLGVLLSFGCSSVEHRAARYPQTWAKLSDADRERVRRSDFKPGDSMKLVYIRHGTPDKVQRAIGPAGEERLLWTWEVPRSRQETPSGPYLANGAGTATIATPNRETSPAMAAQINQENEAAERQRREASDSGRSDGGSRKFYAYAPGPYLFENGVLVPTMVGSFKKTKLQLPEPETPEPRSVAN